MRFLKDIFYLFYPKLCVNCSVTLLKNEVFVCTVCKNELPVIVDNQQVNKVLLSVFYGKVAVKNVRSFLYFNKKGITQKLIHQLKYKNQPELVRASATKVLSNYNTQNFVKEYIKMLNDDSALVRAASVDVLSLINNADYTSYFLPLLEDSKRSVRFKAFFGLGSLKESQIPNV